MLKHQKQQQKLKKGLYIQETIEITEVQRKEIPVSQLKYIQRMHLLPIITGNQRSP